MSHPELESNPPVDGVKDEIPDPSKSNPAIKQVSARKRKANRENAKKSSGPRTATGKSRSRTNALTHGIYSRLAINDLRHVAGYSDLEELLKELYKAYPPDTLAQAMILEKLALDIWRRARGIRFEILESDRQNAFLNGAIDKAMRLSSAVHRMTQSSFEILERLDRDAAMEVDSPSQTSAEGAEAVSNESSLVGEVGTGAKPPARAVLVAKAQSGS